MECDHDALRASMQQVVITRAMEKENCLSVRQSDVQGKGLFVSRAIPKGSCVCEYYGWLRARGEPCSVKSYVFGLNDYYQIGSSQRNKIKNDINHSCEPNIMSMKTNLIRNLLFTEQEADYLRNPCSRNLLDGYKMRCDGSIYDVILFVALRDISPDAELFFDYNREETNKMPCGCKAPSCRRYF